MSDASQGAGWWQASDGKWYPPESRPDAAPPPPPPSAPTASSLPPPPPVAAAAAPPPAAPPSAPGWPPAPGPAGGPPPPPGATTGFSTFQKLALAGAAVAAVGSLLPWASVSSVFGTISKSGMDGDGVITLVLAVAAGALVLTRKAPGVVIALMALIGVVAVIDIADVSRLADDTGFAEVSVGFGLWLVAIGAVLGLVGSIQHRRTASKNGP